MFIQGSFTQGDSFRVADIHDFQERFTSLLDLFLDDPNDQSLILSCETISAERLSVRDRNERYFAAWDRHWAKYGWIRMSQAEEAGHWQSCREKYGFPSGMVQFIGAYDIRSWNVFDILVGSSEELLNKESEIIQAMRICLKTFGQKMTVLDWNHPSYHLGISDKFEELPSKHWPVSPLPTSSTHIFVSQEGDFGFAGDCERKTFTVFGDDFLRCFSSCAPKWLNEKQYFSK